MANWWYGARGKPEGPVDEAELKTLVARGVVTPTSLVWNESMSDWAELASVPELASLRPAPSLAAPIIGGAGLPMSLSEATPLGRRRAKGTSFAWTSAVVLGVVGPLLLIGAFAVLPAIRAGMNLPDPAWPEKVAAKETDESKPTPLQGRSWKNPWTGNEVTIEGAWTAQTKTGSNGQSVVIFMHDPPLGEVAATLEPVKVSLDKYLENFLRTTAGAFHFDQQSRDENGWIWRGRGTSPDHRALQANLYRIPEGMFRIFGWHSPIGSPPSPEMQELMERLEKTL